MQIKPGFPYFEEDNTLGWLVHMKARLSKQKRAHLCLEPPPPSHPANAAKHLIDLTTAQQHALTARQSDYVGRMMLHFQIR